MDTKKMSNPPAANVLLPCMTLKEYDDVGVVTLNDNERKVNTLHSGLIPQFQQVLEYVKKSKTIKSLVIISGKPDCFIAGADIDELSTAKSEEEVEKLSHQGQLFFKQIEELSQYVVAAIHGSCLGGGLELALACDYRVATDHPKTVLGLPEVMLGLLPGSGGTQRLPRLIGIPNALNMMLTGIHLKATKAKKQGVVDHVVADPAGLLDVAIRAARALEAGKLKRQKNESWNLMAQLEKVSFGRNFILQQALKKVESKTRGLYPAPKAIIEVVQYGLENGFEKGLEKERKEFARLSQTSECKGLISLYYGQTELKKNRFGTPSKKARVIGVLGGGLMGSGISLVSLQKGMQVKLKDIDESGLGRARKAIWSPLDQKVKRRSMSLFEAQRTMSLLDTQTDYRQFEQCDVVIEAVFEDIALKHKVIREVEKVIRKDTVFASNTSALPIKEIAAASQRPEMVLGMHYFSPVHKMPLLEIIVTEKTAKEATSIAVDVGLRQGKTVIVVKDGPGFYTTRILAPFMDEAAILTLEGVDFYSLDEALQNFGFPVGPITLIDEVGLDVAVHVGRDLGKALGKRISTADPQLLQNLVDMKNMGRKSGAGFYLYESKPKKGLLSGLLGGKSHKKPVNPEAMQVVKEALKGGPPPSVEEIQNRMVFRMLNEATYCLQEDILNSPQDGDMGAVFGLGFPPFHGGPFRYMDTVGLKNILEGLNSYAAKWGERFEPCPMLVDMVKNGKTFFSK